VPEGDDKPLKYPLMFEKSDVVLINKIDTLSYFDFDFKKAEERIKKLNKNAVIIPISAKTGEGLDDVVNYIKTEIRSL
jgi:hydrogenase nickel incorporation protein HypB